MALLTVAWNAIGNITYQDGTPGPQNIHVAIKQRRDVFTDAGLTFMTEIHLDPSADGGTRPLQGNDQLSVTARTGFTGIVAQTYVLRNVDRPSAIPPLAIIIVDAVSSP